MTYFQNKLTSTVQKYLFIPFFVLNNLDASIRASAQSPRGDAACSGGSGGLIRLRAEKVFCSKCEKTVVRGYVSSNEVNNPP